MEKFHSLHPSLDFWLQRAARYPFRKRNYAKKARLSGLGCKTRVSDTHFFFFPPFNIYCSKKCLCFQSISQILQCFTGIKESWQKYYSNKDYFFCLSSSRHMRFIQIKEASTGDELIFQDVNLNHEEIWRLHREWASCIPLGGSPALKAASPYPSQRLQGFLPSSASQQRRNETGSAVQKYEPALLRRGKGEVFQTSPSQFLPSLFSY